MKEEDLNFLATAFRESAISLTKLGIDQVGWRSHHALAVLESIKTADKAVIGGDVFFEVGDSIKHAYANWHCEPLVGEGHPEFIHRSIKYAANYIDRFKTPSGKTVIFSFVIADVL